MRATLFPVDNFSRGTLPKKRGEKKGPLLGDPVFLALDFEGNPPLKQQLWNPIWGVGTIEQWAVESLRVTRVPQPSKIPPLDHPFSTQQKKKKEGTTARPK